MNVLIIAILWPSVIVALKVTELEEWFNHVKNPLTECPLTSSDREEHSQQQEPLVKVVNCDDPDAIYRYNAKFSGGSKKAKKGMAFNGPMTLTFAAKSENEKYNYGLRTGKCLKLSMHSVKSITGQFVNDKLVGDTIITLYDKSFIKALAASTGVLVGVKRHFSEDKSILSITDASTNATYWSMEKGEYSLLSCHDTQLGKRCLVTRNMKDMKSCLQVDKALYVQCYSVDQLPNVSVDGCKILIQPTSTPHETSHDWQGHSVWMKSNTVLESTETAGEAFECQNDIEVESKPRAALEKWIIGVQDPYLFWHHFDAKNEPLGAQNMIDITFDHLVDRPGFEIKKIVIQTVSGQTELLKADMINGRIRAKVSDQSARHPGWRGRLIIGLSTPKIEGISAEGLVFDGGNSEDVRFDQFATGTLRNGKLNGLTSIFGITSNDPQGHCSTKVFPGLAFIGRYQEGRPVGPCWRGLHGGSWIYGAQGEFTSSEGGVAYLYQDLELAMVGNFSHGLMIDGQEADIIGQSCNVDGIKLLEFSSARGPIYHYQEPTNTTFGDQPHLRDPLDKKYLHLKSSDTFETAGEGSFATIDVPASTVFVLYGGMLYNKYQDQILREKQKILKEEKGLDWDHPEAIALWKYKHNLSGCHISIDIAPEFGPTSQFQGTLGHKVNHKFDPNTRYIAYESARFGLINAIKTRVPIKKGEEFFASYGYAMTSSPKWYRDLYRQFPQARPEIIQQIDEFESRLKDNKHLTLGTMGDDEDIKDRTSTQNDV